MAKATRNNTNLPVRATKCGSCPFRPGSKYDFLREDLELSSLTEVTRICHSTGANNAINRRTGLPPHICRGSRDSQLDLVFAMSAIQEPTDEAWNEARKQAGLLPQVTQDPKKVDK